MKQLFLFISLNCLYLNTYSQNDTLIKIDHDANNQLTIKDSIKKDSLELSTEQNVIKTLESPKKDSIAMIQLVDHWDTTTYNPYKNETKEYPFNIAFTDSTYASPILGKKVITSRYGWRNRRAHKGIDIDLITGDMVMTMLDGKVRFVGNQPGHGKIIIIRHLNGLETSYAHLSKQLVEVNDTVTKGQIIGKGGTTGNARGSHLHLEVSYKGNYIYPEYLFDFGTKNLIRSQNIWVTKNWVTPYVHNSKRQSTIVICNTYEEALESKKRQKQIYVVKRGDTLSGISNKHRVSITSICKTNAIRRTSTLKIGQRLLLIQ